MRHQVELPRRRQRSTVRRAAQPQAGHRTVRRKLALAPVLAALALSWGASADAATLPAGFQETGRLQRPRPTRPSCVRARRPRLRRREERPDQGLRRPRPTTTPTVFADLRTNVHNFWDRGLLGLALDPTSRRRRTSTSSTPTTPRSAGRRRAGARRARRPTAARRRPARRRTAASSAAGCRGCTAAGNVMTGAEQVLIEDWCQQYPSHSVGDARVRRRRRALRERRRRRELQLRRLRPGRQPASNPCGDPPGGVGATLTPPTAEGGALRAQDLRTSGDPVGLDGTLHPRRPGTGAALPGNPLASAAPTPTRGGSSPTACATRSGSRSGPAPTRSGSATSAGTPGRRSTGRRPDRRDRRRTSAGPATRAPAGSRATTAPNLEHLREPLRGRPGAVGALLHLQPRRHGRPGRDLPDRQLVDLRACAFYERRQLPGGYAGRAVLRRLLARLHLGDARRRRRAARSRTTARPSPPARPNPVDLADRPGRRPVLRRTSTAARCAGSATSAPTRPARRGRNAEPDGRAGAADGRPSTAPAPATRTPATRSPTPGTSTATAVRRLDRRRSPTHTYTAAGTYTARLRVTDAAGASAIDSAVTITRRQHGPTADHRHAVGAARRGRSATSISFSGSADRPRARARCPRLGAALDAVMHHCPSNCHDAPDPVVRRCGRAARSQRRTTSIRRTWSCG